MVTVATRQLLEQLGTRAVKVALAEPVAVVSAALTAAVAPVVPVVGVELAPRVRQESMTWAAWVVPAELVVGVVSVGRREPAALEEQPARLVLAERVERAVPAASAVPVRQESWAS